MSRLLAAALLLAPAASALADPRIETHAIECSLDPLKSTIEAVDRLGVVRDAGGPLHFDLNAGLTVAEVLVDGAAATPEKTADDGWTARWRVTIPAEGAATARVVVRFGGPIADSVKKSEDLSFVVGDDTRGVICAEGVYLSEGSGWYPNGGEPARYDVKATIPAPYLVCTQGTPDPKTGVWAGKYAVDGVSLVAGKWKREEKKLANGVVVGTYLGETNAAASKLLLDATESCLKTAAELLGPYAYDRFDIVENWFTTGFGMPEFTLLGRDVVARMVGESQRTGSIPSGYLDHEIVHCWWGNLVYPDYRSGNWCEGLTTYCANYMSQERLGPAQAAEYRRRQALRFTLGATPERDYPVRRFVNKTEDVDNDVGYGKCSMLFHALRREIGDDAFWGTLRRVAKEARGRRFSWDDWRREFEKSSERNLAEFFAQGLDRVGAPTFALQETSVTAGGGMPRVSGTLVQTLAEGQTPWRVAVPVVVEHLEGVEETLVDCGGGAQTRFSILVPSLPLRVTVDPDWHVFRRLAADEVPPCLAATLSRPNRLIVYPDEDAALKAAAELAAARSGGKALPASEAPREPVRGTSYLVFGDAKTVPFLASLQARLPRHFPGGRATENTTVLATARSPMDAAEFITTFVGPAAATAKRARAVFYYQHEGRIVFEGAAPRERGAVPQSSNTVRTLLPDVKAASSPAEVRALIDRLSAPEMNGRLAGSPEDKRARALIAEQFTLAGLPVEEQAFSFEVKSRSGKLPFVSINKGMSISGNYSRLPIAGAVAFVASPATDRPVDIEGIESSPEANLASRALLLEGTALQEEPLRTLRDAASLAKSQGAVALLVRLPETTPKVLTDLLAFPGDLVSHRPGEPPAPRTAYAAAGIAARTGSGHELALPTIAVPHDFKIPGADRPTLIVHSANVGFDTQTISTANVVARVKATGKRRPGVVVLGAHHDHLGPGYPGADDNASGVAALIEAGRVLSANADLLGRDVVLVAFGAEEWGLRGSKAFVEQWPKDEPIVAMINADTIGRRGVAEVNVLGVSKHPRLARVMSAALEQSTLDVGKDIDKFAFDWGSDHWSFHQAGIPAVDLWSSDYAVMNTQADTPDAVDEVKVSRIGRAMALAAFAAAGGF